VSGGAMLPKPGVTAVERTDTAWQLCWKFFRPRVTPGEHGGRWVLLSAHLDTVFPADTRARRSATDDARKLSGRLRYAAGVVGMLAVIHASHARRGELPRRCGAGNVAKRVEGFARGRHFYEAQRTGGTRGAHIVLDGAGADAG